MHKLQALDSELGYKYIEEQLMLGRSVSHQYLSYIQEQKANFYLYAYLPFGHEESLHKNFAVPISVTHNTSDTEKTYDFSHEISFLANYLNQDSKLVLFEDCLAPSAEESDDVHEKYIIINSWNFIRYKRNIYNLLDSSNRELATIKEIISEHLTYPAIWFLSSNHTLLKKGEEVSDAFVNRFIEKLNYLMVGAYDAEGIIIFSRKKLDDDDSKV